MLIYRNASHCIIGLSSIILVYELLLMQVNDKKRFLIYEESSRKSICNKSLRLVSCGYELIIICL